MLIEFTVGNYRSIRDPITLNMTAADLVSKDKRLDKENVFEVDDRTRLLKSAAVYGANASGKSNLIDALSFMCSFVLTSSLETRAAARIGVEYFKLDSEMAEEPSLFEVAFICSGKRYRYGFEVNKREVVSEWLFWVPTTREATLFVREKDHFKVSRPYAKEAKGLVPMTRPNALFLSVVSQFNGKVATELQEWFGRLEVLSGLDEMEGRWQTIKGFTEDRYRREIVDFVRRLDLGISDIQVELERMPVPDRGSVKSESVPWRSHRPEVRHFVQDEVGLQRINIRTAHHKYDDEGKLIGTEFLNLDENESEGTKKLFSIAGLMIDVLEEGRILIVDELDARLHPLITKAIVEMFHSSTFNANNAQLIFTTHDTNLLHNKMFRRDQIWFTEKDDMGRTHLHSLVEYKVRNDTSYEKDYIKGKYGAIPFIGIPQLLAGECDE